MHIIKKETSRYNRAARHSSRMSYLKDRVWKQNRRRVNEELSYIANRWDGYEEVDVIHVTMKEVNENWSYQW